MKPETIELVKHVADMSVELLNGYSSHEDVLDLLDKISDAADRAHDLESSVTANDHLGAVEQPPAGEWPQGIYAPDPAPEATDVQTEAPIPPVRPEGN